MYKPKKDPKVLLIYPPNQLMSVERPRPDGSLGPLYLASSLERNGIQSDILDASVGAKEHDINKTIHNLREQDNGLIRVGMDFSEIAAYVAEGNYDAVGISSNFTPQTRMAFETAKAIKSASPETKIYSGGVNARALKERFLSTGYFDGICLTEGELIFPRMVYAGINKESLHNVAGVAFNHDGKIIVNQVNGSCFPSSLDELPMPAWEKLPFEKYEEIASPHGVDVIERKANRYAPIMTSRGCPFKCTYCHISEEKSPDSQTGEIGKLRLHSIERVIAEIDHLKSLGVERLFFEDDSLLADKKRVKEIFRIMRGKRLSVANVNGVNLVHLYTPGSRNSSGKWEIDHNYIRILREGGFDQMVFPVESGSQRVLRTYATNKINLEQMDLPELMSELTKAEIKCPVNMMIGFPDETEAEIQESINLARKLKDSGAPYVTFFIPIPFPGSALYDIAIRGGYLDRNFDPDIMNWKHPVMKNTIVPPERLEQIAKRANDAINDKDFIKSAVAKTAGHRLALETKR